MFIIREIQINKINENINFFSRENQNKLLCETIKRYENEIEKNYPKKDTGAVLICSKVIHSERTEIDAITRIFKMNGNAVIALYPGEVFRFKLIDAIGNVWYNGSDISELSNSIVSIYSWSKNATRMKTIKSDFDSFQKNGSLKNLKKLTDLNKIVAEKFEINCGRFFGNSSTRCMKMFPSKRNSVGIMVSKRNVDKKHLSVEDFVEVLFVDDIVYYRGDSKPSVDTPIQVNLYKNHPEINYMIHGHSYLEGFPYTENYFPCGDLREFNETTDYIKNHTGGINLINHGFLIYSKTIQGLETLVNDLRFIERNIGNEKIINKTKYENIL